MYKIVFKAENVKYWNMSDSPPPSLTLSLLSLSLSLSLSLPSPLLSTEEPAIDKILIYLSVTLCVLVFLCWWYHRAFPVSGHLFND